MFNNEFPPLGGGTGMVNYHLFRELASDPGVSVDLVTSSRTRDRHELEKFSDRITIHKVPVDNRIIHHATAAELIRYSARALLKARELLRAHRYDLSFAFAGVPAGALCYLLRLTHGLPYIVSLQGADVPGFEARYDPIYPFLKPVLRRIWSNATAVVAISREQTVLAKRTLPSLLMKVIPNGVDTSRFMPVESPVVQAKEIAILCVARLIARKGQMHLLRAFAELARSSAAPLSLLLVGDGDDQQKLDRMARDLGIHASVKFLGYVPYDHMPAIYQNADIFVLPSRHEGMSVALLEAQACGLPVIVTDTGGTAELVEEGRNGCIVAWSDVPALAAALRHLIENPELCRSMGEANRKRALDFGWTSFTRSYLDLCGNCAIAAGDSIRGNIGVSPVESSG